ncbi:MAG: GTP 3',8-cyclase MoaA [Candidatus Marinimicrobia bacterium]|jgi:GTP 3',8-cyclase|nr:GTP 3',8-cyclase MoaA [Candidatus Neomarinimicrobiota bacterium]MBT5956540.1 GTP 3',8-cyclase MoaA [Candidatus Neomarinimicrobiota bacterium]MBT6871478.1 GTP 3',8-cyclase MoaA [Candidatus Neomarinimicrobiota bacterium]MBT7376875.1 GTP 3',8-cyclase MoaA [Candidatus Neomarinimicrobiota bacterium]
MENTLKISKPAILDIETCSKNSFNDQHGRTFTYLRIAINNQCNLRCLYCMPHGIKHSDLRQLSKDEIQKIVRSVSDFGVTKIRFTGGEPLLHDQIIPLVSYTSQIDNITSVNITTNGILLNELAFPLKDAGITGINISLDSLNQTKYHHITQRNKLPLVLKGIESAIKSEIENVKINVVMIDNFNTDEIQHMTSFFKNHPITLRFIELMPFDGLNNRSSNNYLPAEKIINILHARIPGLVSTKGSSTEHFSFQYPNHPLKISVIPAFSRSLCHNCNRIRITADGKIMNCLYSRKKYELLKNMKEGKNINDLIHDAMWEKSMDGWSARCNEDNNHDCMSWIGG